MKRKAQSRSQDDRRPCHPEQNVTYLGYRLDEENACLTHSSGHIKVLRHKSLAVFRLLAQKNGSLVSKDEIISAVWPDTVVTADSLTQCIVDIRRALGDSDRTVLITRFRQGYSLLLDKVAAGSSDTPHHVKPVSQISILTQQIPNPFDVVSLVGRANEMERASVWIRQQANSRKGLLLIKGEPGVGKTRLLSETCESAESSWQVCHSVCYQFAEELPFISLANWLRTPSVFIHWSQLSDEYRRILSSILPEVDQAPELNPVESKGLERYQRYQLYEAALAIFTKSGRPLLFALDNLQWCDQETLGWLTFIAARKNAPVYAVICTQRSGCDTNPATGAGYLPDYHNTPAYEEIVLHPLNAGQSETLLSNMLPQECKSHVSKEVLSITRGLPLQLLELARCSILCSESGQHAGVGVRNFIVERIGLLEPSERELLELCATFGRPVPVRDVIDIDIHQQSDIYTTLESLWSLAFLEHIGADVYTLHDVVRRHVYENMTPISKIRSHVSIAESIKKNRLPADETLHAFVARHFFSAGRYSRALSHHQYAAAVARKQNAASAEVKELEAAIDCLDQLPQTSENQNARIEVLLNLGLVRSSLLGWGAEAVGDAWRVAYSHVDTIKEVELKARVINAYDTYLRDRGRWIDCEIVGKQSYRLRSQIRDPFLVQSLYSSRAALLLHTGSPAKALKLYEKVIEATSADVTKASYNWFNSTHRIGALFRSAQCLWLLGELDRGKALCQQSLDLAEVKSDPFHMAITLFHVCLFYEFNQDYTVVTQYAKRLLKISEKYKFNYYAGAAKLYIAYARLNSRGDVKALQTIAAITREQDQNGTRMFDAYWLSNLAAAKLHAEDYQGALNVAMEGLARSKVSKNNFWDSELNRICGDALFYDSAGDLPDGEPDSLYWYNKSIVVANEQQSASLLKRVKQSLLRQAAATATD